MNTSNLHKYQILDSNGDRFVRTSTTFEVRKTLKIVIPSVCCEVREVERAFAIATWFWVHNLGYFCVFPNISWYVLGFLGVILFQNG